MRRSEVSLDAPVLDSVAHGNLDEVGQCFAREKYSVKAGTQLGLDTDLGDDSVFHGVNVVHTHYALKPCPLWRFRPVELPEAAA
jgi:hypothetical protein